VNSLRVMAIEWSESSAHLVYSVLEAAPDAMLLVTTDGTIAYANRQAVILFGYSFDELIGRTIELLVPEDARDAHVLSRREYERASRVRPMGSGLALRGRRKEGDEFPADVSLSPLETPEWRGVIASVRDVTAHRRLEEHLEHLALHDPLTDLPNRRLLIDELQGALARARRSEYRVALLFIDLDGFKAVNDEHGHEAGDRLLVEVAQRLRRASRAGDTVARIGGDEFVVVCEQVRDVREAGAARDRIHRELEAPIPLEGGATLIPVRASIGVTVCDNAHAEPERILRDADVAMYDVKRRRHAHVDLVSAELEDAAARGSSPAAPGGPPGRISG